MFDLKNINDVLNSLVTEKKKAQARLDELLQRRQVLHTLPLPKEDFIKAFIEEQNLRENDLSRRLFEKYGVYINSPMRQLKIRGRDDSPLTWPKGQPTIPPDVFHVIFGKQVNDAVVKALEEWTWPEEVGPTRAEREKELVTLEKEISELKAWLERAAQMAPG